MPQGQRIRILLVEDSPTQAKRLQRILEGVDFEVEVAGDGQEGLEKFLASSFDLVLSDVIMPRMNGYELCRLIKEHPEKCHVPVILITSLCEDADREKGMESGADHFVNKPYDADGLLDRITSMFKSTD